MSFRESSIRLGLPWFLRSSAFSIVFAAISTCNLSSNIIKFKPDMVEATRSRSIEGESDRIQETRDPVSIARSEMVDARLALTRPFEWRAGSFYSSHGMDLEAFEGIVSSRARLELRIQQRINNHKNSKTREEDIKNDSVISYYKEAVNGLNSAGERVSWAIINRAPEEIRGHISNQVARFEGSIRHYWDLVSSAKVSSN